MSRETTGIGMYFRKSPRNAFDRRRAGGETGGQEVREETSSDPGTEAVGVGGNLVKTELWASGLGQAGLRGKWILGKHGAEQEP